MFLTAAFALALLLPPLIGLAQNAVSVRQIPYHEWQGAYRVTNGSVELIYVPQIGRIMRYAFVGGKNVLWENEALRGKTADPAAAAKEWANFGGDKLWPAPQSGWPWPPDPDIDAAPQTVSQTAKGLKVKGKDSAKIGIRFEREIAMDPATGDVTIVNTMINTSPVERTWSIWEVAQTDSPDVTRMPTNTAGKFAKGYYEFNDNVPTADTIELTPTEVRLKRHAARTSKIGSDSPKGWIASQIGAVQFQISTAVEAGQTYPDDGCALEVYTNNDPLKYIEMELLGPIRKLAPGKRTSLTTHWQLTRAAPAPK